MGLSIITADERLAETRGVKALIAGQPGVGKTSLLRTLDTSRVLFLDLEAGAMSVADVAVDEVRPKTWPECRDLACFLAGPNPNVDPKDTYGQKHFDRVCEQFGNESALDKYETLFVDSLTVANRMCFGWCEQQPEAFTARGEKDTRGAFGLHKRELVGWVTALQSARTRNVVLVALLSEKEDEFGRKAWALQIDGKAAEVVPGIVDVVLTMAIIHGEDGVGHRAFVTDVANEWGYPAKYRSAVPGSLGPLEEPHLGRLFAKLNNTTRGVSAKTQTPRAAA